MYVCIFICHNMYVYMSFLSVFLAVLASLMMSDLNFTREDKFTNFTNREATAQVGEGSSLL